MNSIVHYTTYKMHEKNIIVTNKNNLKFKTCFGAYTVPGEGMGSQPRRDKWTGRRHVGRPREISAPMGGGRFDLLPSEFFPTAVP